MSCPCKKAVNIFESASTPYRIGKTGENVYQEIEFNFSKWLSKYPDAKIDLLIRAPKNGYYLLAEGITDPIYVWKPTAFDLANPGRATVMARMSSGEVRAKSDTIPFEIVRSMDYNLDISEPGPTRPSLMDEWIEDIYEAAARYPKVGEDNYWYVWDVVEGDWKKTDTYAGGTEGKGSIAYVTIDADNHASMSASEIIAAVNDGKFPIMDMLGVYIPYAGTDGQRPVFSITYRVAGNSGIQAVTVLVKEDKTLEWQFDNSPTKTSELENNSGFVTEQEAAAAAPVQSVNGMTGAVTIPTGNPDAVLYTQQSPTPAQQEQARENIGAASADDVDELLSVVTGQTKATTVEEVESSKAYAAGKINYTASKGDKLTVNVSGSAFSGRSATLYFWYVGASSHTSVGTITIGTDTDYTLSGDITAVEVYSANGNTGTVRFEIVKTSGTSGGLVGAVSALNSSVSDLSDIIGVGGTSTTVTHGGGNLTVNLDFSAESGETIGITPSGAALTGTTCFLYFRYVGDSGNTRIGTISVGEETRITLERAIQRVSIYASGAAAGDASLAVRTVGIKDDVDDLVASANTLKGKKLNFLGDSITYGSGASHPFTYYLEQKYGCTCRNYGIAGSTVQYDENRNPMCVRYADMDDDADIVAVMGGTNDYWNNKPLGEMGDSANTTFYGAMDIMIRGLIAKYPNALFYMVTPPHGDNGGNFDGSAKTNAGSMQDIANAVEKVASKYSIPVLDVFNAGGLYPTISDQKDLYYSDGVHLNTEGQKKLAQMHAAFILSGGLHSGRANRYDYATETWVENKGYQTAQDVQTAISGVRQLPAVTASDNGKSLVVKNGAWAVGSGGSGLPDATSASAGDFLRLDAQKNAAWETVLSVMGASIPLGN